ncbi:hypothetical protein F0L74_10030 [Chitinophaga agrisoli]|uniref:Uncharacterized protein n=1 Tax=Chitinophaga agrisoli TaxID=2607653 RepID=A0A5B2VX69_9BACT|nr:hypothetical protein F0L74_10030 [Chitinophaga agrisoli]
MDKIKQSLAEFEEKKKAYVAELQKEFPGIIQPLLLQCDQIKSISWTQYTPYFNDGDECTFGVHNDDLEVNGQDLYDLEGYELSYSRKDREPSQLERAVDDIRSALSEIPDDFYLALFGNHVKVTINRDGTIEKEEYEHE